MPRSNNGNGSDGPDGANPDGANSDGVRPDGAEPRPAAGPDSSDPSDPAAATAQFAAMGDRIAGREGYRGLSGMDAVHRYLVERYHWTLDYVRGLSVDDLTILFAGDDAGKENVREPRTKFPRRRRDEPG